MWNEIITYIVAGGGLLSYIGTFLHYRNTKKLKAAEVETVEANNLIITIEQLQKQVDRLERRLELQDEKLMAQQKTISNLFYEKYTLELSKSKLLNIITKCYSCEGAPCLVKNAYEEYQTENIEKQERKIKKHE